MEIKEKIYTFLEDNVLIDSEEEKISDDDSFMENGIIDSTGILELVSYIEEEFGFEVDDEELVPDNFDSVNKLTEYINRKASG